jgi:hypothetical protein
LHFLHDHSKDVPGEVQPLEMPDVKLDLRRLRPQFQAAS